MASAAESTSTPEPRRGRSWARSEGARGWLMVSPTAIFTLFFLAVPLGSIIAYSFFTQTGVVSVDYTPTLNNYREAFREPLYLYLIGRSVLVSLAVTAITVLTAFPVAYFVSFMVQPSRKSLWLFLITIPFWTSYLIRVNLWKIILAREGVVNTGLEWLGVISEPLSWLTYNVNAVVLVLAHSYAPFAILPIFVALEKIDRSLLEAGQDLGESKAMTFYRVTLPLAVPGIVAAVLIVFIPTIGDYVTPRLIGGSNGQMIANMIQTQFLKLNNAPLGAALSVLSMITVGAISLLFVFLNRKNMRNR